MPDDGSFANLGARLHDALNDDGVRADRGAGADDRWSDHGGAGGDARAVLDDDRTDEPRRFVDVCARRHLARRTAAAAGLHHALGHRQQVVLVREIECMAGHGDVPSRNAARREGGPQLAQRSERQIARGQERGDRHQRRDDAGGVRPGHLVIEALNACDVAAIVDVDPFAGAAGVRVERDEMHRRPRRVDCAGKQHIGIGAVDQHALCVDEEHRVRRLERRDDFVQFVRLDDAADARTDAMDGLAVRRLGGKIWNDRDRRLSERAESFVEPAEQAGRCHRRQEQRTHLRLLLQVRGRGVEQNGKNAHMAADQGIARSAIDRAGAGRSGGTCGTRRHGSRPGFTRFILTSPWSATPASIAIRLPTTEASTNACSPT